MRAITEIPANTPRPIGRTDSFLPGSAKTACDEALAAAAEAEEAAAATEEAAAEEDAESAADDAVLDGLLAELPEALDVALVELPIVLDVALVEEGVGDGVAADTVDTPLTETGGFETVVVVDALLLLVLFVEDVVWDPDELVLDVAVDKMIDEVFVDPVPSEDPPCELLVVVPLEFPPELSLFNVNEHCLISCTSGVPPGVSGVKVIVHVSVAGPIGVFICVTVVTVIGCESSWFGSGRRIERVS